MVPLDQIFWAVGVASLNGGSTSEFASPEKGVVYYAKNTFYTCVYIYISVFFVRVFTNGMKSNINFDPFV